MQRRFIMNRQNMQNKRLQCVTESDTHPINPLKKSELRKKTDAELLDLVQKSVGHTGKDFSTYMNCDFSYSYLTSLLKDRGFINGWYKPSNKTSSVKDVTIISMKKSENETCRQAYMIEKSIASEWKEFNKNIPYKTVTIGSALQRFMDDVKSGHIRFSLEI